MNQLNARREMRAARKAKMRTVYEYAFLFCFITGFMIYADNAVQVRDFIFGR